MSFQELATVNLDVVTINGWPYSPSADRTITFPLNMVDGGHGGVTTLTPAQLFGNKSSTNIILVTSGATTLTPPLGTDLETYITSLGITLPVGFTFTVQVINPQVATTITFGAAVGFGYLNNVGTAASQWIFTVRRESAGVWKIYY